MGLFDATIATLAPRTGVGERWLRECLGAVGVTVPLSEGCLRELAEDAHEAVRRTRTPHEPYLDCLRRHIEARARFVLLWTSTDEPFDRPEWAELVALARKYALPRPWKLSSPAATEHRPRESFQIPAHLVRQRPADGPQEAAAARQEMPGEEILAELESRR